MNILTTNVIKYLRTYVYIYIHDTEQTQISLTMNAEGTQNKIITAQMTISSGLIQYDSDRKAGPCRTKHLEGTSFGDNRAMTQVT